MLDDIPIKEELESQFILRLPPDEAAKVSKYLKKKSKRFEKYFRLDLDPETREAEITFRNKVIPMKLVDLPTIIESTKTINRNTCFKTADICQMLVPDNDDDNNNDDEPDSKKEERKYLWKHGITPALKNVRKQRYRRILKNEQSMDAPEIEKELRWLLRSDNEAIAVRWELVDDPDYKPKKKPESYYQEEKDIFGDILTDSSETDSEDLCL